MMDENPFVQLQNLMTPTEVASMLNLRVSTVREYARNGTLPSIRVGKHYRFERSAILAFIDRQRSAPV